MDIRRVLTMVVLMAGLVWAATMSPLAKRLWGGASSAPRRPAAVGAIGPGDFQPGGVPSGAPGRPVVTTPLTKNEVTAWRERHGTTWARDPFFTAAEEQAMLAPKVAATAAKPAAAPAAPPAYTVKAILISDAGKVAALDGRVVSEGEAIGDERVVEIRPDAVVLERAGQRRRLGLAGGAIPIAESGSRDQGRKGP